MHIEIINYALWLADEDRNKPWLKYLKVGKSSLSPLQWHASNQSGLEENEDFMELFEWSQRVEKFEDFNEGSIVIKEAWIVVND
jgi:hypothetical protein